VPVLRLVAGLFFRSSLHDDGDVALDQGLAGLLVDLDPDVVLGAVAGPRLGKVTVELEEGDQVSNIGPCEEAVGAELAAWLRAAVDRLPDQQAAIFSLTYFEQLDRNEVAAVLSISPESVSTALYKARRGLTTQITVFNGER
jgi:RNA polymerase sigma factor (sigma-70 family)